MFSCVRLLMAGAIALALWGCDGSTVIGNDQDATGQPAPSDIPVQSDQQTTPVASPEPGPTVSDSSTRGASSGSQSNNNTTTPPAPQPSTPRTYSASDITDLILVTGQSNALGSQTAYDANIDVPHERAFAFTSEGWRQADLHQIWDRNWFPRTHPGEDPSNNFAFHMARNIALKDSNRVVGFILVSDPGQRIENWDLNGAFWKTIDARVIDAINQLPHKSTLDGVLWHQGESNAGESDYHQKLYQVIENFRNQSWFTWDKPFICGETANYELINQQLMALNHDGDHWTGCVNSDHLTTQSDGYHFDAQGLRELGRRYADKYLSMAR